MKPPVIGVTGRARSGKDTVAAFLAAATGGYLYAFADPIRAMLAAGFNIDMNDPYWQDRKEQEIAALGGKSPRRLMQTLGTEWGRQLVCEDVWLVLAKQELLTNGPGMVISDVRFNNEAQWVRKMGGTIFHVSRPNTESVEKHSSENGVSMEPSDIQLDNNGSVADLQATILKVVGDFQ